MWAQSREKLLWTWSRRGESPCPSPVLSLEVSHAGSQRKLGKAAHLRAREEKEVGFMSVSRSLWQARIAFSLSLPHSLRVHIIFLVPLR